MARRWEYKLVSTDDLPTDGGSFWKKGQGQDRGAVEAYLNQLGDDGWEIVGIDFIDQLHSLSAFQALARRER